MSQPDSPPDTPCVITVSLCRLFSDHTRLHAGVLDGAATGPDHDLAAALSAAVNEPCEVAQVMTS